MSSLINSVLKKYICRKSLKIPCAVPLEWKVSFAVLVFKRRNEKLLANYIQGALIYWAVLLELQKNSSRNLRNIFIWRKSSTTLGIQDCVLIWYTTYRHTRDIASCQGPKLDYQFNRLHLHRTILRVKANGELSNKALAGKVVRKGGSLSNWLHTSCVLLTLQAERCCFGTYQTILSNQNALVKSQHHTAMRYKMVDSHMCYLVFESSVCSTSLLLNLIHL